MFINLVILWVSIHYSDLVLFFDNKFKKSAGHKYPDLITHPPLASTLDLQTKTYQFKANKIIYSPVAQIDQPITELFNDN